METYVVRDGAWTVATEINPALAAESIAFAAERKLHLDGVPLPLWLGDIDGSAGWGNRAWRTAGLAQSSLLGQVHPDDRPALQLAWQQADERVEAFKYKSRLSLHAAGRAVYRWHELHLQPLALPIGEYWQVQAVDIDDYLTEQQVLQNQAQLRERMLNASVDCIKVLYPDGNLEHMNRSGCIALGLGENPSQFGMPWLNLLPAEVRDHGVKALTKVRKGQAARFEGMSITPDKQVQYWDNILTPIIDGDGNTTRILCISRDVSLQRVAEQRLRQASDIDELTGLYNRRYFRAKLRSLLSRAKEQGQQLGLLLIDLDYFKHINDTLGHPAGDYLLKQIAKRLQKSLPAESLIARLGGDEFAIVFPLIDDAKQLIRHAELCCAQLQQPITYGGKPMMSGMSIGAAIYPQHAVEAQELMKAADTALNDLKAGGRGGVRLYCERMLLQARTTALQLARAREIITQQNLMAFYQPKVHLQTGELVGFEALMRWHKPSLGVQLPNTILEAFNDYQLATQIGEQMQHLVLRDIARWLSDGLQVKPVSINAAPVEFLRDDYAERLLDKLARYQIPAALVEVEVTEHVLNERGSAFVARALTTLKQHGVRIALDDFGTGHSSLANLRDYPVDCLKIDCGFVWRITEEPSIYAIVQAVAQLGPSLAIDVVAEGVETEPQLKALLQAGCTIGQGCLWSEALAADIIEARYLQAPSFIGN